VEQAARIGVQKMLVEDHLYSQVPVPRGRGAEVIMPGVALTAGTVKRMHVWQCDKEDGYFSYKESEIAAILLAAGFDLDRNIKTEYNREGHGWFLTQDVIFVD